MKATAKDAQGYHLVNGVAVLHHWHFDNQCATNGNRYDGSHGAGDGKAILFCMASGAPGDPGCPALVEVENDLGTALWLGVLLLTVRSIRMRYQCQCQRCYSSAVEAFVPPPCSSLESPGFEQR